MPDNERLCALAQAGDAAARERLLENNLGFIRRTALEMYGKAGERCVDCGGILDKMTSAGRTSTFCPNCQIKY